MSRELLYREAINEALALEMHRDDTVFIMGQGIAERGGSYKVTKGLKKKFGAGRVIDTPIAEASTTGMAVGAAIQGKRPIIELTYIDFTMLGMDMIVNQAAKYNFVTGGTHGLPLVIRTQGGAAPGYGIHHSQSLEALFYHIPGLKIAVPATPYDAKGLLATAVRDDHPVLFIEHKLLYNTRGNVPKNEYTIPFGDAELRRTGSDCTVVGYSLMANKCTEAADILADKGIECDVIDLRTLVPMDRGMILKSVKKTGRLVIVNEAVKRGSVASDISAWITENAFEYLKAPVMRISGAVTPVPYNKNLVKEVIPDVQNIISGVKSIIRHKNT
ncbi:alpha-ketoacid dehydrogenase subunit beta [Candidatus Latescibacterota bacterium]